MVGYHPASGYVQGINDLVTPFFVVFLTEYIIDGRLPPRQWYVQGINDLVTPFFVVFLTEYIIDGRLPPRQWLCTGYQRPSHTLLCSLPHRVHH